MTRPEPRLLLTIRVRCGSVTGGRWRANCMSLEMERVEARDGLALPSADDRCYPGNRWVWGAGFIASSPVARLLSAKW